MQTNRKRHNFVNSNTFFEYFMLGIHNSWYVGVRITYYIQKYQLLETIYMDIFKLRTSVGYMGHLAKGNSLMYL